MGKNSRQIRKLKREKDIFPPICTVLGEKNISWKRVGGGFDMIFWENIYLCDIYNYKPVVDIIIYPTDLKVARWPRILERLT